MPDNLSEKLPNINFGDLMEKMTEISEKLPEMMKNTVTVSIIASKVPEEGIDVADFAKKRLNNYTASLVFDGLEGKGKVIDKLNSMSDKEIVQSVQAELKSRGLHGLSKNIEYGNISRDDLIKGLAEYGHSVAAQENIDPALYTQVRAAMGNVNDPALIEGLVLAESHIEKMIIQMAENIVAEMDSFNVKVFDGAAMGKTVPLSEQHFDEQSAVSIPDFK